MGVYFLNDLMDSVHSKTKGNFDLLDTAYDT